MDQPAEPTEHPHEPEALPPEASQEPRPTAAPTEPAHAPDFDAEGLSTWRAPDRRFLTTERIGSLIVSGVVLLGGAIPLLLDVAIGWWPLVARVPAWAGFVLLAALLWWASFDWPRMQLRATTYRYGPAGIEIRRGVWWKRHIRVPRSRIQHSDVTQGPLLRKYGLASLTIHTAATSTPSITLAGLARDDAVAVRDALNDTGGDEGV